MFFLKQLRMILTPWTDVDYKSVVHVRRYLKKRTLSVMKYNQQRFILSMMHLKSLFLFLFKLNNFKMNLWWLVSNEVGVNYI